MRRIEAPEVARRYREGEEIALLDVREQWDFCQGHALLASSCPLSSLEMAVPALVPCKASPVVVLDDDAAEENGLAVRAARKLASHGYEDVSVLDGGLSGWVGAGYSAFTGIHAFSKLFGEVVEHDAGLKSVTAEQLAGAQQESEGVIVVDVRSPDEYRRSTLPGSINIPAGELLRSLPDIAADARQSVVLHCGGRTRGIIAAQTVVAAGLPHPVSVLENGTIGWRLSGRETVPGPEQASHEQPQPAGSGLRLALDRLYGASGAREIDDTGLAELIAHSQSRATYFFDVRSAAEFDTGHHPLARHAPAGQLVQETDSFMAVRNARVVLFDDLGDRAAFAAYWLWRMGWRDIAWIPLDRCPQPPLVDEPDKDNGCPAGFDPAELVEPQALDRMLAGREAAVIDLSSSLDYEKGHVPGAHFAIRSKLSAEAIETLGRPRLVVLTSEDGVRAMLAKPEVSELFAGPVAVLRGGNRAWCEAGFGLEAGARSLLHPAQDMRRSIYDGSADLLAAMKGYIDWEVALVNTARTEDYLPFALPDEDLPDEDLPD
ncbi:rhodanese-like domain-containing protein [Oricola indica]|uniref:rhodanese-like domain-containing protein n=1 Tax=Oricola indica TaxID=2872591 RepID=UPI001CBADC83